MDLDALPSDPPLTFTIDPSHARVAQLHGDINRKVVSLQSPWLSLGIMNYLNILLLTTICSAVTVYYQMNYCILIVIKLLVSTLY